MKNYGKELTIDIHNCNPKKFTRYAINKFFKKLCAEIDMEPCRVAWWDYKDYPEEYKRAPSHLKGTSAVQFISTSNITIHALDELEQVYLNVFSCKDFDTNKVVDFSLSYFEGNIIYHQTVERI